MGKVPVGTAGRPGASAGAGGKAGSQSGRCGMIYITHQELTGYFSFLSEIHGVQNMKGKAGVYEQDNREREANPGRAELLME